MFAVDFIPGIADLSYLFVSSFIAACGIQLATWLWTRHKKRKNGNGE